jgi:hypothetical protein
MTSQQGNSEIKECNKKFLRLRMSYSERKYYLPVSAEK